MEHESLKILAIDDTSDNLLTLRTVLRDLLPAAAVLTAADGPTGLALARAEDPDVILLDIVMPEMDGFAVCRTLKADARLRDIPVVFLTALRSDRQTRLEALEAGAEGFLAKPFDEVELLVLVRTMAKIKAADRLQQRERDRLAALVAERTRDLKQELLERVHAEASERRQAVKLSSIYRAAPIGIGMVVRRVFQEVNDTLCEMTGYARHELLGQSARLLYPTDEDYEYVGREKYRQVAERGVGSVETRWRRKDGEIIEILLSSTALDGGDLDRGVVFTALDITARKRIEAALRESEARYRAIFENMAAACCVDEVIYEHGQAVDYRILDVNPAYERITGIPRSRAAGALASELYGSIQAPLLDIFSRVAATGEPAAFETHFAPLQKDLYITVGSPGSGRFSTVFSDITERKQVEAAQRERERQSARQKDVLLRLMLGGAPFRSDLAAALAQITEACAEIIGVERVSVWRYNEDHTMIRCLDLYELSRGRHSAGEELCSSEFPTYMQTHQQGEVIAATDVRADPRTREIPAAYWDAHDIRSLVDAPVWLHGQVGGIVSFEQVGAPRVWTAEDERFCAMMATLVSLCFEAAERAQAEAQLRRQSELQRLLVKLAAEFINLPLPRIDEAIQNALQELGKFVAADRAYAFDYHFAAGICTNTFEWCAPGVSPQIEALQAVPLADIPEWTATHLRGEEIVIPDVSALPPTPLRAILEAQDIKSLLTLPLIGREGVLGFVGFDSVADRRVFSDDEIALLRLFGQMLVNVRERKQAEEQLQAVLADLQRANADLEQYAYIASHDLQEPLRMVASYVQVLSQRYRGRLDADADEFIGYVVEGVERMQQLILDLLAYSRLAAPAQTRQTADAALACELAQQRLAAVIAESSASITCEPLPTVAANMAQLADLFQHLIANAIKFRRAEPPRIHIKAELQRTPALSASPVEHPHAQWVFSVQDNGIGIEAQYFERIFVIFQRLHSRRNYTGNGIGLAICKRIVERHGGRIWVESTPGQGSTFYFTLPAES